MAEDKSTEITAMLDERYEAARAGDYFGVLKIEPNAPPNKVNEAYFALAKLLHPDMITRAGLDELRERATTVFKFATEAKDVLSDRTRRARFLKGELNPTRVSTGVSKPNQARNVGEIAKISFHKASVFLNKRAYAEAEKHLRKAVEAEPGNARYWQTLGWAVFQSTGERRDSDRLEEARVCWDKSLEMNYDNAQSHYYMALYHKARGEMQECRDELEQALFQDSAHVEAKRELRLIRMRARKGRESGSFLARLMTSISGKGKGKGKKGKKGKR